MHNKIFSFRNKIFFSYLSIIIFTLGVFLLIDIYRNSYEAENNAKFSAEQNFEQTSEFMDFILEDIERTLNQITFHKQVQEIFKRNTSSYAQNKLQQVSDSIELSNVFFTYNTYPINNTILYLPDEIGLAHENVNFYSINQALNSDWYKRLSQVNHSVWFPPSYFEIAGESRYISIIRKIVSDQNYNQLLGIIRLEIPESVFAELLDKIKFTKNSFALIYNKYGEIISTSSNNLSDNQSYFTTTVNSYIGKSYDTFTWKELTINNNNYITRIQNIKSTDWNLVLAIPKKELIQPYIKARNSMIFIVFIIIPITFLMSYFLSYTNTKRISLLISHMRRVVKNDFKVAPLPEDGDEIGELIRNYNKMISRISNLLEEKYLLGNQVKSLELKSLQAQINPHFLYNTLDLINWMSLSAKVPEISELVKVLSKFYRLSLSRGEDMVSLKNELDHIICYVQIQNKRFANGITLDIDISPEYLGCTIPKLTLQPIVENSILHGILEKEGENGSIFIKAHTENSDLVISVTDDGVGIVEEKLKNLKNSSISNSNGGFGVKNIHERLKLNFGVKYGLKYSSELGHGTTVWIRIPKMITEEQSAIGNLNSPAPHS